MITDAKLDASIRAAVRECSDIDRETLLMLMAEELSWHLSEPDLSDSIARVRAKLMASLAAFAERVA